MAPEALLTDLYELNMAASFIRRGMHDEATFSLFEPYLLNQMTFQTTIASKAARCTIAADGKDLVDFSLRRTQGLDAAINVARVTSIVGFSATSNVEAARRFDLPVAGTMAHSYIE